MNPVQLSPLRFRLDSPGSLHFPKALILGDTMQVYLLIAGISGNTFLLLGQEK